MPLFSYKIQDPEGKIVEGTLEGEDRYALARDFVKEGKTVISVEPVKSGFRFNMDAINILLSRVKPQDKIIFAKNLGAMIKAGLSLSRALSVLTRQTKNPKFKKIISDLDSQISKGGTLSDGMAKYPKVFSQLFISMVRAGEQSGNLAESLGVVADHLEKSYTLAKKIKGAMIYPAVVLTVMIAIGILMLIYVVPTLTDTFKELNIDLPASTRFIIATSDLFVQHTFLLIGGIIAFVIGLIYAGRTKKGQRAFEFTILRLPLIGKLVKETNSARTARTLSSLLSSGVDIVEGLNITKDVLQNSYYKEVIDEATASIQKGNVLSQTISSYEKLYPILVGEMIEVGEETGKLSEMLLNLAVFYEDEVDNATKNMTAVIEPFLMVFIGTFVGFFAISMISPMYSITGAL